MFRWLRQDASGLQPSGFYWPFLPRATPWAGMRRAFGALRQIRVDMRRGSKAKPFRYAAWPLAI